MPDLIGIFQIGFSIIGESVKGLMPLFDVTYSFIKTITLDLVTFMGPII